MEFFKEHIKGVDKLHILIAEVVFIGLISNYITYKLAFDYKLSVYQMVGAVTILMTLTKYLIEYITPLKIIQNILNDMKHVQIFGVAIFSASNIFANMFVLYKHYGLLPALGISFGASTLAGFCVVAIDKFIEKTKE